MSTSLTASEVKMSLADQQFRRLWQAGSAERAVSEDEAFEILEKAAGQEGNGAWSSATLLSLCILGVVIREGDLYRWAETFPELPEDDSNRHGTEVFNAALERRQAEERRKREIADREAQREYENGPAGRERRERIELITEVVREVAPEVVREVVDDSRITLLEFELRQAKARITELEGSRAAA